MEALIVDAPEAGSGAFRPTMETASSQSVSLEAAELELALQSQDISEQGFAGVILHALEILEGTLLFDMPAAMLPGYQRVAAASTGAGDDRRIFLIHLADDGATIKVEEANDGAGVLAGFAASCMNLMDRLAA